MDLPPQANSRSTPSTARCQAVSSSGVALIAWAIRQCSAKRLSLSWWR
jgi:hypothetical protein